MRFAMEALHVMEFVAGEAVFRLFLERASGVVDDAVGRQPRASLRLLADLNLLNTLAALILVGTSAGQIFAIFVLRNFVAEIPQELFEAAEIDGANHFQQMWTVVLPLCGPILGTVGVMHFISEWNEFVLPLIVIRDSAALPVMVQLQRLAGEYIKFFGPLMAGYAMASIPVIVLFIFSMRLFVKAMTESSVKG